MTISELYEWAKNNGVEEYEIITTHDTGMSARQIEETYINHETREVEVY